MQYKRENPYERNRFFMEPNAILSESLSLSSDIPLYAQLVGIIKRSISSGALAIGDLLPSEAELCRALNVSRNTVRQAIGELEDEGLVVRKRGKGTFVADPNTNRRGVRYSFTTEVSSLGKTPSSTLVDFGVIVPTRAICEKMELREGTSVYCFTRVRNVDGEPLILETSYYPQFIYPNLTREMVQTHSFYSLLYHVGITPFSAEDTYEAVMLDAPRANLLSVEPGSCAFYHQRRTKTEDGRIYEYTCSYIRGDRVRLEFDIPSRGIIGIGIAVFKFSRLGNDSISALNLRLAELVGLPFSIENVLMNLCLFVPQLLWGRRYIGLGTIINSFCIGFIVTFTGDAMTAVFGSADTLPVQLLWVAVAVLVIALGCSLYQTADLGVAPYDALSLMLADRLPVPYFGCRVFTDALCAVLAFLLGGLIGLGTLICAFGLGPFVQFFTRHFSEKVLRYKPEKK